MKLFSSRSRHRLRRLAGVATAGVAAMTVVGTLGVGTAFAGSGTPNAGAPEFNSQQASQVIRDSGSDTTIFMQQKIGDLYTTAGLYGCQLVTAASQTMFGGGQSTAANVNQQCQAGSADIATTDDQDNWDRVEVDTGVNSVGSGAGQNQLCGAVNDPLGNGDYVSLARSSKPPAAPSGCTEQGLGYAKDGVPSTDFLSLDPACINYTADTCGSGKPAQASPGFTVSTALSNGHAAFPPLKAGGYSTINGGLVGPVADGWLPADPIDNTPTSRTGFNGTRFVDLDNTGAIDTSVAFRMFCETQGAANEITDWGQLTNLGPNLEVTVDTTGGNQTVTVDSASGSSVPATIADGQVVTPPASDSALLTGTVTVSSFTSSTITLSSAPASTGTYTLVFATGQPKLAVGAGIPVGIPLRIQGINTNSGTNATFSGFAQGATRDSSGACASSSVLDTADGANDPNSATAGASNPEHIALENNAHQEELFSTADFPNDPIDQAIEEETTVSFISFGVYQSNSYAGQTTIVGTAGPNSFSVTPMSENSEPPSNANDINNVYPTARTLFNIILPNNVDDATADYANWQCDTDQAIQKQTDLNTGMNYDSELSNIINTQFGFVRLTDITPPVTQQPVDTFSAPNDSCTAQIAVTVAGDGVTITVNGAAQTAPNLGGVFPGDLVAVSPTPPTAVVEISGPASGVPSGTTVTGYANGNTNITLSNSLTPGNYVLEFTGVPAVLTTNGNP